MGKQVLSTFSNCCILKGEKISTLFGPICIVGQKGTLLFTICTVEKKVEVSKVCCPSNHKTSAGSIRVCFCTSGIVISSTTA